MEFSSTTCLGKNTAKFYCSSGSRNSGGLRTVRTARRTLPYNRISTLQQASETERCGCTEWRFRDFDFLVRSSMKLQWNPLNFDIMARADRNKMRLGLPDRAGCLYRRFSVAPANLSGQSATPCLMWPDVSRKMEGQASAIRLLACQPSSFVLIIQKTHLIKSEFSV